MKVKGTKDNFVKQLSYEIVSQAFSYALYIAENVENRYKAGFCKMEI